MRRCVLLVVGFVGFVVGGGCSHQPPPEAPANRLGTDVIVWPSSLDHRSTPQTHRAAAVQLMTDAGLHVAMGSILEVLLQQQLAANPKIRRFEDVMRRFFQKYLGFEAIRDDLATLYMSRFSELQLRQMSAFYHTPTGQLSVRELPKLFEAGAQIGKRRVEEHIVELQQEILKQGP